MNEIDNKMKGNNKLEQLAVPQKYKMLYDFTPHGYFTLAKNGSIVELNLNGCKMLGLKEMNSEKTRFIRYVTHDTQSIFVSFFEKIFKTQEKQTCKISIVNRDNSQIFTQLEGIYLEDNSECLILAIDITDYEMLKNKATRYQNIFESITNGILTFDAESGKIADVNQALTNIVGYDSEDLMGKTIWKIPIFNEMIPSKEKLPDILNNLKTHYTIKVKDKVLELEMSVNTYVFGNSKEIQLNFWDISERINYLQALEENKNSLILLNNAKDKFFTILAHDLRSPFTSILGFAELLLEEINQGKYLKVKQFVGIIKESTWNAIGLLSNLMEWSRSQNGKMQFKPEYVSLDTVLNEVLAYSAFPCEQKSITIEKKL